MLALSKVKFISNSEQVFAGWVITEIDVTLWRHKHIFKSIISANLF